MQEWHGILVDVSQKDKSIFKNLKILGQKKSSNDEWVLLKVGVPDEKLDETINLLQKNMSPGEFYFHFYRDSCLIVVFRKKIFRIKPDKSTWTGAVEYGKSLGIPERQLDFYPCRVEDETY
jgi:hypothetical protein